MTVDGGPATPGLHRGASGVGAGERTSIYSGTGIFPTAGASERNSLYAGGTKQGLASGDAGSVRSGLYGHGRADSVNGSVGGLAVAGASNAASPREREMEKGVEEGDEDDGGD
jgi:hypothetical protein